ncbi:hypothetical protein EYC80_002652 [Monilinia laxa]|uniref:Uncharacterized protein n=1 Tax=Monilinia laxa TaxID=61186 RepID=A0A5N6K4R8_MONLA|nr:hypothetical protein EYC80_002652 [Monilinia laxa]
MLRNQARAQSSNLGCSWLPYQLAHPFTALKVETHSKLPIYPSIHSSIHLSSHPSFFLLYHLHLLSFIITSIPF